MRTSPLGSWLGSIMGEHLELDTALMIQVAVPGRPLVVNAERKLHWAKRAREVADIREAAAWQWLAVKRASSDAGVYPIHQFVVVARPQYPTYADLPDTGSCFPSVKSIVDGARDAGVVVDDKPSNVLANIELPAEVKVHLAHHVMVVGIIPVRTMVEAAS